MSEEIQYNQSQTKEVEKISGPSLFEFLQNKKEAGMTSIAIFPHDNPDPDAMASGLAMKTIGEALGFVCNVYYGGDIVRTTNKAMKGVLGLPLIPVSDLKEDKEALEKHTNFVRRSVIAVVDTAYFGEQNCLSPKVFFPKEEFENKNPDIVIDHHGASIVDIDFVCNKSYGSCSTIMTKLMTDCEIIPDKINATALYYGLMSDTDDMTRLDSIRETDEKVAAYLKDKIDFNYYLKIVTCKRPRTLLDLEGLAKYRFIRQEGDCIVSGVGIIPPGHNGLISEIADNILHTYEQVERTVVIGIVDTGSSKYLSASLRNSGEVLDSGTFMKEVFGKKCAGGRKGKAAAYKEMDEVWTRSIDHAVQKDAKSGDKNKHEVFDIIFQSFSEEIFQKLKNSP